MPRVQRQNYKKRQPLSWYNKKYSVAEIATKALKATHYIKGMINCEKHYKDTVISLAPLQAGTITHLTDISQGDDAGQRTGSTVLLRSIYLDLSAAIGSGPTNTHLRLAVVMDTMQTGTPPTVAQIYQTVGTLNAPCSPLNSDNAGRFKILYDKRMLLNTSGSSTAFIRKYIKLYHHIRYTGPNGTDEYKNNIWLVCLCNEATTPPSINGISRLGYYDN